MLFRPLNVPHTGYRIPTISEFNNFASVRTTYFRAGEDVELFQSPAIFHSSLRNIVLVGGTI